MKFIKSGILLLCCATFCAAQTPADRAFKKLTETLGPVKLGMAHADFLRKKTALPKPGDSIGFRLETEEKIEKDGLQSVTYYFGATGEKPLYEMIFEFSEAGIRDGVVEKLFGPANHPEKPDYWILGTQDGIVSLGWAFGSKFVLAANLPGTEWAEDGQFKLPGGFEPHKNLPLAAEWPETEIARFFKDLQLQIDAAAGNFEKIKGAATEGGFQSKQTIGMAETSILAEETPGNWQIRNQLTSGMEIENAVNWQASLSKILDERLPDRYRLTRTNGKTIMGRTAGVWNVSDKQGKPTGVQVATVYAGKGGLFSVFVVVLRG